MRAAPRRPKIIVDTMPLIKLFAGEEGWEVVKGILSKVEIGELEAGISVVTLTEVYYKYLREGRADLAVTRTEQLRYATYLKKVGIDEKMAVKAGEFKGRYRVSVADAFIAACAHSEGAIVVSDDPGFRRIREVETLTETELWETLA